jgi:hypothetical protein
LFLRCVRETIRETLDIAGRNCRHRSFAFARRHGARHGNHDNGKAAYNRKSEEHRPHTMCATSARREYTAYELPEADNGADTDQDLAEIENGQEDRNTGQRHPTDDAADNKSCSGLREIQRTGINAERSAMRYQQRRA